MRHSNVIVLAFVAALALAVVPACGGGGQGFRVAAPDPLAIGTVLPQLQSGDEINFEIPIAGGCDGPYVLEVIGGTLPEGIGVEDEDDRHHIVGILLEHGLFEFTLKVTDTSCVPFFSQTATFRWEVTEGPVRIVAANPPIIPVDEFDSPVKYPDVDALEPVVYGSNTVINLIAAGGTGPYVCAIVDDPNDPDDNLGMPTGTQFAVNSSSIFGQPIQVLPGGTPFRVTVRVTDSLGQSSERKFQWEIRTPPIIIPNEGLVGGLQGDVFSDVIGSVDGVPPILFELVDEEPFDNGTDDPLYLDGIQYVPGDVPDVPDTKGGLSITFLPTGPSSDARLDPVAGRTGYPAETDAGPDYTGQPYPPEGVFIHDGAAGPGTVTGLVRRRGDFAPIVHAYSSLVPNERGQHAFKRLPMHVDARETVLGPGDFAMDPTFTVQGAFLPGPEWSDIPELEVKQPYSLTLVAHGGVPQDGFGDAPHLSQRAPDLSETDGKYTWDYDDLQGGDVGFGIGAQPPLPGVALTDAIGVFETTDPNALQRSSRRFVKFSVTDEALPKGLPAGNLEGEKTLEMPFGVSVGPDKVIITESNTSFTGTTATGTGQSDMHDSQMFIRVFEVISGSGSVRNVNDTDLSPTHTIPAAAALSPQNDLEELLATNRIDLDRITVNPATYADDVHSLNPNSGRAQARVDTNRSWGAWNNYYSSSGGWQPSVSGVELPGAQGLAHDPQGGIYSDGGLLYAFHTNTNTTAGNNGGFDTNGHFGFFVVRKDASIQVPFAVKKIGNTWGVWKFGDGMLDDKNSSVLQMVPICMSPDGRFAAAKLVTTTSTSVHTMTNWSNSQYAVIFSLCGEKVFGESSPGANDGETYQVIDTGMLSIGGSYMYSTSMVMTNRHLYFLSGNYTSTYASWRDHFIHRFEYKSAGGAFLPAGTTAVGAPGVGTNWTNNPAGFVPMQTAFHKYDTPTSLRTSFGSGFTRITITVTNDEMYLYDGWNMYENAVAPMPFRVSGDGRYCALLAGQRTTSTSGAGVMQHYVWVDNGDASGFRQATNSRRASPHGAGRGFSLARGPRSYQHWGRYTGPTTAFEISHNGQRVAAVHNTDTSVSSTSNSSDWRFNRSDIVAATGTGSSSNWWTGRSEKLVTANVFGGSIKWRFGALAFTKDNDSLIFWGGASKKNATGTSGGTSTGTTYDQASYVYAGTFYSFDFSDTNRVEGIMPTAAGGVGTFPVYTSSNKFAPSTPTWTQNFGNIMPMGGFISRNRDYMYVVNMHPNASSDQTQNTLLGINIENTSHTNTPSNHSRGRGFKVASYPNRRGFLPTYDWQPHYALEYRYYAPAHMATASMQYMNDETGYVYWLSHYQSSGPSQTTSSSFSIASGPSIPVYWGDYGYRGVNVEGFSADVGGPVARLSHNLGSNTSSRAGHYLVASEDGTRVAYVWDTGSTSRSFNREQMGYIRNIKFNANTGVIEGFDNTDTTQAFTLEGSNGRAGEGMSFDSTGNRLYYAYLAGSGNERNKQLVEFLLDPADLSKDYLRVPTQQRYNVLYSGR